MTSFSYTHQSMAKPFEAIKFARAVPQLPAPTTPIFNLSGSLSHSNFIILTPILRKRSKFVVYDCSISLKVSFIHPRDNGRLTTDRLLLFFFSQSSSTDDPLVGLQSH